MLLPALSIVALCALVCLGLFRLRNGMSQDRWMRAIRFAPTEEMPPDRLFGCLLSANLALLEHDNFNQVASALPARRVRAVLAAHWRIDSPESCRAAIFDRLAHLGRVSEDEAAAFSAWAAGASLDTLAFDALHDVCRFLSKDAQVTQPRRVIDHRFSMLAWDIQQVAYMARLGCTAGFVPRETAERVLEVLQPHAREAYRSWNEFSLAVLVGMGMRSPVDNFDLGGWPQLARSHTMLLESRDALLRHAAPWDAADAHRPRMAPAARPMVIGHAASAFDTLF